MNPLTMHLPTINVSATCSQSSRLRISSLRISRLRFVNLKTLCVATICASIAAASFGQATADDFLPPAQGGTEAVRNPEEVKESAGVVQAGSQQDAFNASAVGDGVENGMVRFPGGVGFYGTGEWAYMTGDNLVAVRKSKRAAYVRAFLMAQGELSKALGGITNESAAEIREVLDEFNDPSASKRNLSADASEFIRQAAGFFLQGAAIWKVHDDVEARSVRVTVVTSPTTRGAMARFGQSFIETNDLHDALGRVLAEVNSGVIPPVGGFVLNDPASGEVVVVGFGCAVVSADEDQQVQNKLNLSALRAARMRADDALCGLLVGSDSRWKGSVLDAMREEIRDFDLAAGSDPLDASAVKVVDQRKSSFLSRFQNSEWWSAATAG